MALNLRRNFKTYYSIESTLRYWEQEFSFLRPKTSGTAKIRQYQEKDIEQIKLIHNLVKVRGFKISAARDILQKNRKGAETTAKALSELIEMRTELEKLRDHLEML